MGIEVNFGGYYVYLAGHMGQSVGSIVLSVPDLFCHNIDHYQDLGVVQNTPDGFIHFLDVYYDV